MNFLDCSQSFRGYSHDIGPTVRSVLLLLYLPTWPNVLQSNFVWFCTDGQAGHVTRLVVT